MPDVTVGAKVSPETKARLIELAGSNGSNSNQVLKELLNGYINNHDTIREKVDHPEKTVVKPEFKTLKLETIEPTSDIDPDDFVEEMWDSFVAYAKDQGYSLIKTDHLTQLLNVIELRKGDRSAKESETNPEPVAVTCPGCGESLDVAPENLNNAVRDGMEFNCPECGRHFEIDREKIATKKSSPKKEAKSPLDLTEAE